ncbi:wax ester synthase/diacylglycerol acyltransferase 11-like isoform X1 [Typha angustifolia]|uniref:wax ester synthase/diacylglycerol acyltransferase 11-like isoform X1 n=1 Tax=Typha angustifolia TaxID=59011 RepID=UPI003C2D63FE
MDSNDAATLKKRPLAIKTTRSSPETEGHERARKGGEGASNGEITEEPLSPAGRLFHQPNFNCHIVAVMGIGKPIDVAVLKAGLEVTLIRHPRFSSIQLLDESKGKKARWVRTNVNVDDHIIIPGVDPTASSSPPDKLVEDYVSSLSTSPMDLSRPLWDLHVLNFPTSEAAAVIVLRIHHSLGDGTSLTSLLLACTRKSADPDALPSLADLSRPRPRPRRSRPASKNPLSFLLWLWAIFMLAWRTLVDVAAFVITALFLKDTATPFTGTEGVEFRRKRFLHRTVELDDVKQIKNAMHCTVNDVLLGITSFGLSKYLERNYGENNKKKLPTNIRMRSTLLVNIRPTPGIHALSDMMEEGKGKGSKWGNWLGYIILPFPVVMYEDPLDYIRKGKATADRKKKSLEAIFTYMSGDLIVKIFGIKAAAALCHRLLTHTTFSFSNIMGPVEEVAFYGHPIVYLAPSVYGHPQALTVHYQSYMNKMKIVIAVDDSVIPDPHQILDDLAESLIIIRDATATRL